MPKKILDCETIQPVTDPLATFPADDPEARAERAAIMEHDGGIPRWEADLLAGVTSMTAGHEAAIRNWCRSIDETDETLIDAMVAQCRADPWRLVAFLRRTGAHHG